MPSYADLVLWVWVVALIATFVGLALAWRALSRIDQAVVGARLADPSGELTAASGLLAVEIDHTMDLRTGLHGRFDDQHA